MDYLLGVLMDYLPQITILSMGAVCLFITLMYESKIRRLRSEGKKMTGSIRHAHVRTILADYVSEAMDKAFADDKISEEEYLFWCSKLAESGLADLRHKPKPDQLKYQLRAKRIEEGKPTTLAEAQAVNGKDNGVVSMMDAVRKRLSLSA